MSFLTRQGSFGITVTTQISVSWWPLLACVALRVRAWTSTGVLSIITTSCRRISVAEMGG